jgi:hypothetical protein
MSSDLATSPSLASHPWVAGQPRPEGYEVTTKPIAVFDFALTDAWYKQALAGFRKATLGPWLIGLLGLATVAAVFVLCYLAFPQVVSRELVFLLSLALVFTLVSLVLGWQYTYIVGRQYIRRIRGPSGSAVVSLHAEGIAHAGEDVSMIIRWHSQMKGWRLADGFFLMLTPASFTWLPTKHLVEGDATKIAELFKANLPVFVDRTARQR